MHAPSVATGHAVRPGRIFAELSLRTLSGWTRFRSVVVDTGAPVSVFPREFWRHAAYVSHGHASLGGIVQRPECRIDATLAQVECLIADGVNAIGPLLINAYLAESDEVAALLGFSGVLDMVTMHFDVRQNDVYLQM